MNQRAIVFLILLGLFLPVGVNAATPQQSDLHPHATVDVWISPLNSYAVYMTNLDSGDIISVDIEVTAGGGIDIYILDAENYVRFTSLDSFYYKERYLNRGSLTTTYSVASPGTYYVVFWNDALFSNKHIEGSVGSVSSSSIGGLVIVVLVIVALACICGGCKKINDDQKKKKQQPHQAPSGYAPPQTTEVAYCPYCGTPKQIFDAKFCSKCGRAFSGPGFE